MERTCCHCMHFRQHYVRSAGQYMPLNYGHCIARRCKKLPADFKSCEQFTEKEKIPDPERYVFRIEIERL